MTNQCQVRHCRKLSVLSHKPLGGSICQEHWEKYCDGEKLEIVAWEKTKTEAKE